MQSKRESLLEALSDTSIGFIGSWLITVIVLSFSPFAMMLNATITTVLCTVWSLSRKYVIRRYWNKKLCDGTRHT